MTIQDTKTPRYGAQKLFDLVVKNAWLVVTAAFLLDSEESLRRFLAICAGWAMLLSVNTIINVILAGGETWNISPLSTNYITASLFIYTDVLICFVAFLCSSLARKNLILIPYGVMLFAVFLLPSRSTILSFFATLALAALAAWIFRNLLGIQWCPYSRIDRQKNNRYNGKE